MSLVWDDSMSDGCSVPFWVHWFGEETEEQRAACIAHDRSYFYGGTEEDRRLVDAALYWRLVEAGMSPYWAWQYWAAVRVFGAPFWGWAGINTRAWAWGAKRFAYVRKCS